MAQSIKKLFLNFEFLILKFKIDSYFFILN